MILLVAGPGSRDHLHEDPSEHQYTEPQEGLSLHRYTGQVAGVTHQGRGVHVHIQDRYQGLHTKVGVYNFIYRTGTRGCTHR